MCDLPVRTEGSHPACWCGAIGPHMALKTDRAGWHREHRRLARAARDDRRDPPEFDPETLAW